MLPRDQFRTLVKIAPLVAVDLIVRSGAGKYLLGRRLNAPAANWWFAPGGRIFKGELFSTAFWRIVRQELGPGVRFKSITFQGVYEHHYEDNFNSEEGYGTHYIILAYNCVLGDGSEIDVTGQHGEFRFFSSREILSSSQVHPFTQAYCLNQPTTSLLEPPLQANEDL